MLALDDGRSCSQAQGLAAMKLASVESRIADLNRMRRTLKHLIAQCGGAGVRVRCPIIETLAHDIT